MSVLRLSVVAVTLRTFRDREPHKLLDQAERLRDALGFSRLPHRTTLGRRISAWAPEAEQQIALLGNQRVAEGKPLADPSPVSAIEGRRYQAQGPKWRQQDRNHGLAPLGLRNVSTESKGSKSGSRGSRARRQAGGARAGFPRSNPDLCRLASEPSERSPDCHGGAGSRRPPSDRRALGGRTL